MNDMYRFTKFHLVSKFFVSSVYSSAAELDAFYTKRCMFCRKCDTFGFVELNCSDQMAFLFIFLAHTASDLNKLGQLKQIISFRNANPACPVVRFKLAFVTLHKEYMCTTLGVSGHAMAAIRHQDDFYFFDSMNVNQGRMKKMAGLTFQPSLVKNTSLEFVCYSRI